MCSKGLSNHVVCLSVRGQRNIETAEIRVIRSEKGTITFELFLKVIALIHNI